MSSFFAALTALFISGITRFYSFLVFTFTDLDQYLGEDLASFVGYCLNFEFLGTFFAFNYYFFLAALFLYALVRVTLFVHQALPYVSSVVRSAINWSTGDS